jgi:RNA 2',3'-cyclic 3'-phosphodiesterase
MRLFVGLDLDAPILERLNEYVRRLKQKVPDLRFVSPETYHVTLKFIGETQKRSEIDKALRKLELPQFDMSIRGTGFFPNDRAPRVFWAGIEAEPELRELATGVSWILADLGFEAESSFKPHLTLARSGSGSPRPKSGDRLNPKMKRLVELTASEPHIEFGTMTAREFYLYESKLSPQGAKYSKVERYELVAR